MRHTSWERTFADPFTQLLGFDPFRETRRAPRERAAVFTPPFDVRETEQAYVMEADLPGVTRESLEIEFHEGLLTVKGSRDQTASEAEDVYHVSERRHGSFERSFRLPDKADPERVEATLTAGVLRVSVAKKPEATPRKIVVTPTVEPDEG